ncbi:MAG TPA: DUF2127 domain-containing protein [Thioploca sp.]|nr:DUF2127 domain-containing protein [Thioploca sp.]
MKILSVLGIFISGYILAVIDYIWIFIQNHWIISSAILLFIIISSFTVGDKDTESTDDKVSIDGKDTDEIQKDTENNTIKNKDDGIEDNMEKSHKPFEKSRKVIYFFRFILILFVLTLVTSIVLDVFLIDTLPNTLQQYLSSQEQDVGNISNKETVFIILFMIFLTVLFTIFFIGIWNFKRWARVLFVILILIYLPSILVEEEFIIVPLSEMFGSISDILCGMLLVLMYTKPVKFYFSKKQFEQNTL